MKSTTHIGIIGDGGWGTALAINLASKGATSSIWGYDASYLEECQASRENKRFLPDVTLPDQITFEASRDLLVQNATLLISAVPTRFLRSVMEGFAGKIGKTPVVSVTKGIENETLKFPSSIIEEIAGATTVGVLSGPTMAEEVARAMPASATVACNDLEAARSMQETLNTDSFRIYASDDRIGVELGGAVKNVIAIAAGLCDGMKLGDNAKAAMLARGLAELRRLGAALGAKDETFSGLSGVGDLYTSCASPFGRNRGFGERVGAGMTIDQATDASGGMVVEGVNTAKSIHQLAGEMKVEMPICEAVYRIVYEELAPSDALRELLSRDLRVER